MNEAGSSWSLADREAFMGYDAVPPNTLLGTPQHECVSRITADPPRVRFARSDASRIRHAACFV